MSDGIKASFNHPPEWVADVLRDRDEIEGDLVRVTKRAMPSSNGVTFRLQLVCTAIVRGRVVELLHNVGDLGWTPEKDSEVHDKADAVMRPIEEELAGAGLEVRSGMWEYA